VCRVVFVVSLILQQEVGSEISEYTLMRYAKQQNMPQLLTEVATV